MEKSGKLLFSGNGMKIVNTMFLLSLLIRNAGFIFIAYSLWIVYLAFCIKHSDSQAGKLGYKVFIGFAVVMILLNIYFMLKA